MLWLRLKQKQVHSNINVFRQCAELVLEPRQPSGELEQEQSDESELELWRAGRGVGL